jgi:hypothetical protein
MGLWDDGSWRSIVILTSPLSCSHFVWHTRHMNPPPTANPYKRHRLPVEILSHCAWLYLRFCLSYRDVEELMAERGLTLLYDRCVTLTYEAVRFWCPNFGQVYAHQLRRRRPRPSDAPHGPIAEHFRQRCNRLSAPCIARGRVNESRPKTSPTSTAPPRSRPRRWPDDSLRGGSTRRGTGSTCSIPPLRRPAWGWPGASRPATTMRCNSLAARCPSGSSLRSPTPRTL